MGWAERCNPNSEWNKKRALNMSSNFSSPILSESNAVQKVSIPVPVKRDEPMVIEITPKSVWSLFKEFLCRMLRLTPKPLQSHAPTS